MESTPLCSPYGQRRGIWRSPAQGLASGAESRWPNCGDLIVLLHQSPLIGIFVFHGGFLWCRRTQGRNQHSDVISWRSVRQTWWSLCVDRQGRIISRFFLAGFWSIAGEISTSRHPSTPAFTNERQFMYMGGRGRRLHAEMSVSVGSSGPYRMLTRTSC